MKQHPIATASTTRRKSARWAMTLAELTLVLSVLGVTAALVVPVVQRCSRDAHGTVTQTSLRQIRDAIVNTYYDDAFESLPYPLDVSRVKHPQLAYLYYNPMAATVDARTLVVYNPATRRGWRGPYLLSTAGTYVLDGSRGFTAEYGETGDPAPLDGWGHPIVLQQPSMTSPSAASFVDLRYARLVSAGPNGILETPRGEALPTAAQCGDDILLPLGAP